MIVIIMRKNTPRHGLNTTFTAGDDLEVEDKIARVKEMKELRKASARARARKSNESRDFAPSGVVDHRNKQEGCC